MPLTSDPLANVPTSAAATLEPPPYFGETAGWIVIAAGPSTGGAIANGHYDIPARSGPRAGGTYRVEITAYGPERQYSPNVSGEGPNISVRDQLIPPKFNQNSSLRATITDVNTRDTHDFDLSP